MASLSTATDGEITEFKGRLGRAGFSAEIIRKVNTSDDNELAKLMYEALMRHPRFMFTTTEKQIARVRQWNEEFDWGISDEAFAEAEKSVPAWPDEKLVAVVLVPYLADKANEDDTVTTGLERTFQELWMRAKAEQNASWRWDGYEKASSDTLRLLSGIEHKPGLRWEVIDLGSNRNKQPMDVRSSKSSPQAGILATAMLHPKWIKAMDRKNVPYVWLPGYEVDGRSPLPGYEVDDLPGLWKSVPRLSCYHGKIRLSCWSRHCHWRSAVPSFFRE